MRDKKRLETMVADDDGLVRRTGDIEAYFELAREGEDVSPISSSASRNWPHLPRLLKPAPCWAARPTG